MLFTNYEMRPLFFLRLLPKLVRSATNSFFHANGRQKLTLIRVGLSGFFSAVPDLLRRRSFEGPKTLQIILDSDCRASCKGCAFGSYLRRDEKLSLKEIDGLLTEARALGIQQVYLIGADPFHDKDYLALIHTIGRHADMLFLLFTEGTAVGADALEAMEKRANIIPMISLDGFAGDSDERKRSGSHERIMDLLDRLRNRRMLFGISTMVSQSNLSHLIDLSYFHSLRPYRPAFVALLPFTQVSDDAPYRELTLGQRAQVFSASMLFNGSVNAFPVFDLYGIESRLTSCPASQYTLCVFHTGTVSPCFLISGGTGSIKRSSLADLYRHDPLLLGVRQYRKQLRSQGRRATCLVLEDPGFLRTFMATHELELAASSLPELLHERHHEN